jgi:hypothetical protein
MTNRMFSILYYQLPIYGPRFQYHLNYMAYLYLTWFDMQGPAVHMTKFWVGVDYWQTSGRYRDFYTVSYDVSISQDLWLLQWSN